MKMLAALFLSLVLSLPGAERTEIVQKLQKVAVTIRAEANYSRSEGSGICRTVDFNGTKRTVVITAAHVISQLMTTTDIIKGGKPAKVIKFSDPSIIRMFTEEGRQVGEMKLDARVLIYSERHDLAVLLIRSKAFPFGSAKFYWKEKLVPLGTKLIHTGSLLGSVGHSSATFGYLSAHGRVIDGVPYCQTDCAVFPGSSGGLIALESTGEVIGVLQRGAGESFGLFAPHYRLKRWAEKVGVAWIFTDAVKAPDLGEIERKLPIMDADGGRPASGRNTKGGALFPFMPRQVRLKVEEK